MAGLLVVGELATDVLAWHREPLARGTDTAARVRIQPGGAGGNVASWAVESASADVRLFARVGRGELVWQKDHLRKAGVRPYLVADDVGSTPTVVVLVDAAAERTFLSDNSQAARLCVEDWRPSLLDGVGAVHLSGHLLFDEASRALARLVMKEARARRLEVSVDPASAGFLSTLGVERVLPMLQGVDILLPNADEACLLSGLPDPADAASALSRLVPLAVVTLGGEGALIAESGEVTSHIEGWAVDTVDTTGAGDAFTGAFLAARLEGAAPQRAAELGCQAGARAVCVMGARPS
ncbi:carbohydrate kinase family protein [Streptomyces collinus]|uniref:carbohydrate kinase family protein n=1 Tax=Streptomyces collinus TaxID=42684 RepID=UPI00369375C6